jgi:hypothetical protein
MAANNFEKLISAWDPVLRRAFLDSIYTMRDMAQVDHIATMLKRGDVEGALRGVGLDPVAFRAFDKSLTDAFEAGGKFTSGALPIVRLADGFKVTFQFNIRNPAAEKWLAEHSSTLVAEILDDQRSMIRDHLRAGMAAGNNPRTTALDLVGRIGASGRREGGVIGLTSSQEQWVRNYAAELASDNPRAALARTLRDKRFDRAVSKAADSGEPIPADLIDKMVTSYTNRALQYRAEAIARSEAMAALHEAQDQAMQQAVDTGAISQDQVTETWHTAEDSRVRDSHDTMDGQEIAMGEIFVTGNGVELEYPGDPNGPAEEIINCRCWREFNVDFLARLGPGD